MSGTPRSVTAISRARSTARMQARRVPSVQARVLSLGGSVLHQGEVADDARYLGALAELLRSVGRAGPTVVVTGGGKVAREYIRLGEALGLTHFELDELGIEVTRLHARLLAGRIGLPTPSDPPRSVSAAIEAVHHASPVVMGGTEPGHTTDAVAALVAVRLRAPFVVNATSVDGVYSTDPRRSPSAHRLEQLSWEQFLGMLREETADTPGQQFPFDRLGAEMLARARIPLHVLDGRDLAGLRVTLESGAGPGSHIGASATGGR